MKRGVARIRDAFVRAKDGIGAAWNKLKGVAARPVNFVLGTVYNNGIRKWWNAIADKVGLSGLKLDPARLVSYARGTEDHRAQIARGGAWRVWAEPETGGEAYIPLAASKRRRSTEILANVANRFGLGLTQFKDGGILGKITGWGSRAISGVKTLGAKAWEGLKKAGDVAWKFVKDPAGTVTKTLGSLVRKWLGPIPGEQFGRIVGHVQALTQIVDGVVVAQCGRIAQGGQVVAHC
jgi:hypothetical protein